MGGWRRLRVHQFQLHICMSPLSFISPPHSPTSIPSLSLHPSDNPPRIHQKQVLALYACVLPFAIVDGYGWWAIPTVAIVAFTLYGIEGIGEELENPFGYDKNDIKMDGIIEDTRCEMMVLLEEWKSEKKGGMFE
jgi:hypothetical protein